MLIGRFKDNWSHGIGPLQDMSSRPPLSVEQRLAPSAHSRKRLPKVAGFLPHAKHALVSLTDCR